MDADDLLNINMDELKKKVAEKLGISIEQLEEEVEKLRAESKGWVGERTALLLLLERWGVNDRDLFEDIVIGNSISSISELNENVRSASLIARIVRIFPEMITKNNKPYAKAIIDDGTGKAILYLFGESFNRFKELSLDIGDIILLRRVRVQRRFGNYLSIIANDNSRIDIPNTGKYSDIINLLPEPPIVLSVYELLDSGEILDEGDEVNVKGVIDNIGEIKVFKRRDGSEGKVVNVLLADENVPAQTIRLVVWDDMAGYVYSAFKPGDIVEVHGGRIKFGYSPQGERRLEVHIPKLGVIKRVGVNWVKIERLGEFIENKILVYGVIVETPQLRNFERDGETFDYLVFRVSDGTGFTRVVIWDPDIGKHIENISIGKKIRIYGRVKENNGRLELHVSKLEKNIEVDPEDFPEDIELEQKFFETEKQRNEGFSQEMENFGNLANYSYVSLIGRIDFIEIPDNERAPWQLIIADNEDNRVKILGWDRELANKIKELGVGVKIKITNLKTGHDTKTGEFVVKTTQRTELELVKNKSSFEEKGGGDFIDAKALLKKREVSKPARLDNLDLMADETKVIASIIMINNYGKKRFCKICGAPIISEENICENGHINEGEELRYVNVTLDDGRKSYDAIITEKTLENLKAEKENRSLPKILENLVGLDLEITVKPKIRNDGKIYLIVRDLKEPDYKRLTEEILQQLNTGGEE